MPKKKPKAKTQEILNVLNQCRNKKYKYYLDTHNKLKSLMIFTIKSTNNTKQEKKKHKKT